MNEILNNENKIGLVISYCQEKINQLNTLKESNIEDFKKLFNSHINYVYNNKKEEFKEKINNILFTLNDYFKIEFSKKKNNLKEIESLRKHITKIKIEINEIFLINQNNLNSALKDFKKDIKIILNREVGNIENLLKDKDKITIIQEFQKEIQNKITKINEIINIIINNINSKIFEVAIKGKKDIDDFLERTISLNIKNFEDFLLLKIGDKNLDLSEQLYKEIKINNNYSQIFNDKGFIDFFKSAFSSYHYIRNNLDIIVNNLIKKLEYIIMLLNNYIESYIEEILDFFNKACELVTIEFKDDQSIIWKEIEDYYHIIKNKIENIQNELCENK